MVFKPLGRIRTALQEIASGEADLTKRLDVGERNEIGDVAHLVQYLCRATAKEIVRHVVESTRDWLRPNE